MLLKAPLLAVVFSILTASSSAFALHIGKYHVPDGPDHIRTPGVLCTNPTSYRYQERIPYCERNVSSSLKVKVIRDYDQILGYSIQRLPRSDFKIDHFIPLSIGGSNDESNLWPQHKDIYPYSDPLESEVSNLMMANKIKQAEAIRVIKECKLNLSSCEEGLRYLKSLNGVQH
jgi:hypothetical protein